ncbi:DUF63 family protein [Haloglomus halophilum]|uniref:DUF63 family protein n=1 Tax=Haloglomus halophilum TaxID=2962672 RepID=UPI0020C9FA9C|nr:DUF63 family protein [Haloglomus halophilum]
MAGPPAPALVTAVLVSVAALLAVGCIAWVGPPVTRRLVLAGTPWMVLAGLLYPLAATGVYGGPLAATLGSPLVVPVTVVLATVLWIPLVQAGRVRTRGDPAGYLVASGTGVVAPVLAVTVLAGRATVATLVPLALAPVVAAIAAAAVVFVLGLSAAPALAAARSLALLAVYAQALHAVAVVVAVDALGVPASGPMARATVGLGAELVGGFGIGWPFLLLKLCAVALLVVGLGRLAERRETVAYVLLGTVAALGVGPAVAVLVSATLLA